MNFTIRRPAPGTHEIDITNGSRRWLATVTRTDEYDLRVDVDAIGDAPPATDVGEIITGTVGFWLMPFNATPEEIATDVIRWLRIHVAAAARAAARTA